MRRKAAPIAEDPRTPIIPCAHNLGPCSVQDYQICTLCGTYVSMAPVDPAAIYERDYWTHENGRSTISEQSFNVDNHRECGVTKNEYVMGQIEGAGGGALEIACAPGNLLRRLHDAGFTPVFGIDVDRSYREYIQETAGPEAHLMFGYFPEVTARINPGSFSLIVALDLFEHIHDPGPFLTECKRLLKDGGQLLLMLPMVSPGEEVTERFFCPAEHVYVHSVKHVTMMLEWAGFEAIKFGRWTSGHESVSARVA